MAARQDTLRSMVVALFTLIGHIQRAGRRGSGATLGLLRLIAERDGVRPSEAAVELGIHQSTVTRQLQSLEAAGFIDAHVDRDDKRASRLTITPEGVAEIKRLGDDGFARFTSFLKDWDEREVQMLGQLLQKLIASLAAAHRGD